MPNQQSILFLTHLIDERVLRRFQHLYESAHNQYDIYFGWHCENTEAYIVPSINYDHIYTFCFNDLLSLNYSPHGNSIYHNTNYVMQKFRKDYPQYKYYWFVEYDVVFTGDWRILFDHYANKSYDFISSHIEFHDETNNQWCWWSRTFWGNVKLPKHALLKSFNPICRYSDLALDFLDQFLQKGVNGHFETIIATALYNYDYSIIDMSEHSMFKEEGEHISFYQKEKGINKGTIRWRPVFGIEEIMERSAENILYHPVK